MSDTRTVFSIQSSGRFKNNRFGFCPPDNDICGPFFCLAVELLALAKRTQFHLSLTHVIRFSGTFHCRGNGFRFINRFECILPNDFNVVGEGQSPLHVFFALIEQSHAVHRVEMAFFFGRGQQTGSLGHSRPLCLQFKEAVLKLVQAFSEGLSFGFLVVPYRP